MSEELKKHVWKKLLHEIYLIAPNKYTEDEKFNRNTENHAIAKKLSLKQQDFSEGVSFLEEQGLIEIKKHPNYFWWILTEKGFNVALENEKAENMEKLQITAGLAATLIAFMSLSTFFINNLKGEAPDAGQNVLLLVIGLIILASAIGLAVMVIPLINKAMSYSKFFSK